MKDGSRLTDAELPVKGTAVVVKNVEDLVIYQGELNPEMSAPCDNWFEDNEPPRAVPKGCTPIRQLDTGCLAFLVKHKREEGLGLLEGTAILLSIFLPN